MDNSLVSYTLHLADSNLILAQRNAAWCGHGPILEQDIAITNISLDLIGQSRNFYQYAAQIINEAQKAGGSKAPAARGEGVGCVRCEWLSVRVTWRSLSSCGEEKSLEKSELARRGG